MNAEYASKNNKKCINTPALAQNYSVKIFWKLFFNEHPKTKNFLYDKIRLNTALKGLIILI